MSSLKVRQAFEGSWQSLMPSLPLYGTINREPDRKELPSDWATVEYDADDDARISLGETACWRETGVISVVVFGQSGSGQSVVVGNSDETRDAYRDWRASGLPEGTKLSILRADPGETGEGSSGTVFGASVTLHYQYDRLI